MLSKGTNPIKDQEWNEKVTKAADSFWSAFQMTENGRVKSTLLLYSFCLCWVFIAVYAASFAFLLDPLDALVSGAPGIVAHVVEAVVPALVGAVVCVLPWPIIKDKRIIPASYTWIFLLSMACLIAMLVMMKDEPEARNLFLQFFVQAVPAPILLGGGLSAFLYSRYLKKLPAVKKTESWKRQ